MEMLGNGVHPKLLASQPAMDAERHLIVGLNTVFNISQRKYHKRAHYHENHPHRR